MRQTKKCSSTYISVAICMLIIELFNYDNARYIIKPLLTIVLILYMHNNTRPSLNRSLVTFALGFSFIGDVLLLIPDKPNYFIFGLVAFLLAHICYIITFITNFKPNETYLTSRPITAIISIVFVSAGLLYSFLFKYLGEMLIPVTIYMVIIITMVVTATLRSSLVGKKSFYSVLSGSFFFLISDSILAINKFAIKVPFSGFWIMLTYMLAQYLIIDGMRKYLIKKN
ncbi:MAG: lysoplasmalogenase [Burkholderiales bacterium]|nr:lysoplasmalogenase [Burkholderiales bacterium]